jgi:hypothetical protein
VIADAICFNAHFAIRLRAWHQYPDAPPTASRSRRTIADLGASGIGRIEAKSISPATAKPGPPSEPRRNFAVTADVAVEHRGDPRQSLKIGLYVAANLKLVITTAIASDRATTTGTPQR